MISIHVPLEGTDTATAESVHNALHDLLSDADSYSSMLVDVDLAVGSAVMEITVNPPKRENELLSRIIAIGHQQGETVGECRTRLNCGEYNFVEQM